MVKDYLPILLIPAAWVLSFLTIVYPRISSYWIEHMHYFMLIFLTVFAILGWRRLSEEEVISTWRNIIVAGIPFTVIGTAAFLMPQYSSILGGTAIAYWIAAPGIGFYLTADSMEGGQIYRKLAIASLISAVIFVTGALMNMPYIMGTSFVIVAIAQTISILKASRMDKEW